MASSGDFFAVRCGHIHARTICEDVSGNVSQTGRRQTLSSHTHGHAPLSCPIVIPHRHTPVVIPHRHTTSSHTRGHALSPCPIFMPHRHVPSSYHIVTHSWSSPIVRPHRHTLLRIVMSRRYIPSSLPPPPTQHHVPSSSLIVMCHLHTLSSHPISMSHDHVKLSHPISMSHRHPHRHLHR